MSTAESEDASFPPGDAVDAPSVAVAIQAGIDRILDRFRTSLDNYIRSTSGLVKHDGLPEAVHRGFRSGIVHHLMDGRFADSFGAIVCEHVLRETSRHFQGCEKQRGEPSDCSDGYFDEESLRRHHCLPNANDTELVREIRELRSLADRLIVSHDSLAKAVARLFRHPMLDKEDLEQEAQIGLRLAALTFDASNGAQFSTYARDVIRRHLVSILRAASGPTDHQARQVQEFMVCRKELRQKLVREPKVDEVIEALGWGEAKRTRVMAVIAIFRPQRLPTTGIDDGEVTICAQGSDLLSQAIVTESERAHADLLSRLEAARERLSTEAQQIVNLRYVQGLSFPKIADRLGLTDRQVRTRHERIIAELEAQISTPRSTKVATGSA